jgi:hypothetical protein
MVDFPLLALDSFSILRGSGLGLNSTYAVI